MNQYYIFVILCVIAGFSSYINYRYLRLPKAIGLTVLSALIALLIALLLKIDHKSLFPIYTLLYNVNFKEVVLEVLLGYLVFASAMHLNFIEIKRNSYGIFVLSSLGVVISTFTIGTLCWVAAPYILGIHVDYVRCLMIGAIFSPTDPVTVFDVFKKNTNVPKKVKTILSGEALFNDVFSIVLFLFFLSIVIDGKQDTSSIKLVLLFMQDGIGGALLGIILGYLGKSLMSKLDDGYTLIIISLALVSFGSWFATHLHVSEAITMAITGIVIGNSRPQGKVSVESKTILTNFWMVIDELLNAFLFVLVGIEILEMNPSWYYIAAGVVVFIISILARYSSVVISLFLTERNIRGDFWKNNLIITWAGLRGGVSIALALSIPLAHRQTNSFSIVYIAVFLSIFIQGITFKRLLDRVYSNKVISSKS
ncbi:sodium/hydrogen exchanger family protein [Francisella philomiragia]|uniref:cation:proton antiporter n=1 Tax=Francisella philomiragia TaxID=28110 RepID=UPI0005A57AA4|nr:sodium:proton antiporter [Francisella philomiragia]AJI54446.1 sodium/hydrogen exchanger family protein [Francisella philomiragia]MBK2252998.1 sodium:proton antiporter [Francisella philomiragia]